MVGKQIDRKALTYRRPCLCLIPQPNIKHMNNSDNSFSKFFPKPRKVARKPKGLTAPKPPKAKTAASCKSEITRAANSAATQVYNSLYNPLRK
jgi:hypothetical protein